VGRFSNEVLPHAFSTHPPIASRGFFFFLQAKSLRSRLTAQNPHNFGPRWTVSILFDRFIFLGVSVILFEAEVVRARI